MDFEWDDEKSRRNESERGISFDAAALIFEGKVLEWQDVRRDYGEERWIALGIVEAVVLVVVYTDRLPFRRIISARLANRKERERWRQFESRFRRFKPPDPG